MCVLLLALLVHGGLGLKSSNECNSALGLEDLRIEDSQLTAQSHYESLSIGGGISVDTEPKCARLNKNNCAWCAPRGNGQYLQVDLRRNFTITGIATQGFEALSDYYVRRYKVCHSRDGHTWSILSQGMSGNHDGRSVVRHTFKPPLYTRYIRVYPMAYRYRICMRMELYGCSNFTSSLSTTPTTPSGTNNTTPENLPITRTTAASSTEKLMTIHSTKDQTVQTTPRAEESHPSERQYTGKVAFHLARNDSERHSSKTWIIALVVVAIAVVIIIIISLLVRFYLPQRRKLFSRYRYPSNEIEVYLL